MLGVIQQMHKRSAPYVFKCLSERRYLRVDETTQPAAIAILAFFRQVWVAYKQRGTHYLRWCCKRDMPVVRGSPVMNVQRVFFVLSPEYDDDEASRPRMYDTEE